MAALDRIVQVSSAHFEGPVKSDKLPATNRRDFLAGGATSWPLISGRAKAQSAPDPAKLGRVSIMTYNYRARLKLPSQNPDRTLAVFDIPPKRRT
jgi:hypothetical protein